MKNIKEFYIRVKAPYNSHIKISYAGYREGRNLALYQARGAQQDCFFVVFHSEIRQMPGNKVAYRANKPASSLSAVSLRPCENPKSEAKFGPKKDCSKRPWGRRAVTLISVSCLLVVYSRHSASVLRDPAIYLQIIFFLNMTPREATAETCVDNTAKLRPQVSFLAPRPCTCNAQ